jgi:hypothetical protein
VGCISENIREEIEAGPLPGRRSCPPVSVGTAAMSRKTQKRERNIEATIEKETRERLHTFSMNFAVLNFALPVGLLQVIFFSFTSIFPEG